MKCQMVWAPFSPIFVVSGRIWNGWRCKFEPVSPNCFAGSPRMAFFW